MLIHSVLDEPISSNPVVIWDESMQNQSAWNAISGSTMYMILSLTDCDGNSITQTDYWTVLGGTGPQGRIADPNAQPEDIQWQGERSLNSFNDLEVYSNIPFGIFPNPNNGSFMVLGSGLLMVEILDASGKLIQSLVNQTKDKLQINGLGAGLYLVRAQMADGSVENGKVIVSR
jgi:hypothetical protein